MRVLMVCLGNICRSPLAAGVLLAQARAAGLDWQVDSAGTAGWHTGRPADRRSVAVARAHGVNIQAHRGRMLTEADFDRYEAILVMDRENQREVLAMASTPEHRAKVALLDDPAIVPDPYYDDALFAPVYTQIAAACARRLQQWTGSAP